MDTYLNKQLEALHTMMLDIAADMDYYGGINEGFKDRSIELIGAAAIVKELIDSLVKYDLSLKELQNGN